LVVIPESIFGVLLRVDSAHSMRVNWKQPFDGVRTVTSTWSARIFVFVPDPTIRRPNRSQIDHERTMGVPKTPAGSVDEVVMNWELIGELIDRAKNGDRVAFNELVMNFRGLVRSVACRYTNDSLSADELTQDVFVHIMTRLHQLREHRCFAMWLRRITVRMAQNRAKRGRWMNGTDPEVLQNVAGEEFDVSANMEREDRTSMVRWGLSQLRKLDRETLEAHYFQGQSIEKMAQRFDAPEGTIKRRLFTARQRLQEVLGESHANAC
jgi:RNA polymerase sigma-70 factor, ECF subfamily